MADSYRIPIGRYFSATPDGPKDRVVTAITVGGKVALPGVVLDVTPKMRMVIAGRNIDGYNRAEILGDDGKAHVVYLRPSSHEGPLTFVSFDVPDYGQDKFGFRVRLESSNPNIASITIDKNFNYRDETAEEEKDRKDQEAAAAEAQEEAENAQKGDSEENKAAQAAEDFENRQTENLKPLREVETIAGDTAAGIVEGTAAAVVGAGIAAGEVVGAAVDDVSARPVHTWQGSNANKENTQTPAGQIPKPTDFAKPVSETSAATSSTPEPGNLAPGAVSKKPAPTTATPGASGTATTSNPFSRRQPPPSSPQSPSQQSQPASVASIPQRQSSVVGGAPQRVSDIGANIGQPPQSVQSARTETAGTVETSGTASFSTSGSVSSQSTVKTSGTVEAKASASLKQSANISAKAQLEQSASLEQASKAGISIEEKSRPKSESIPESSVSEPATSKSEPKIKTPPRATDEIKSKPESKDKLRVSGKPYNAELAAFKEKARDFDIKLKLDSRVAGASPVQRPSQTLESVSTPGAEEQVEEDGVGGEVEEAGGQPSEQEEEATNAEQPQTAPEEKPVINPEPQIPLPQKLPTNLASMSAGGEKGLAGEAVEGAAGAELGTEAALVGGPVALAAVVVANKALKDKGKDKGLTLAADAALGPEAGIVISFLKKHWKLVVALLAGGLLFLMGLIVVFLLTVTTAACNNWFVGGLAYMSGYGNVCSAVKNISSGGPLGTVAGGGLNTNPGNGTCTPAVSGPASMASLGQSSCFGPNAQQASIIAQAESGGDPFKTSSSDVCRGDGKPFSIGLFQINLLVHTMQDPNTGQTLQCPSAFTINQPYIKTDAGGKTYYDCSVNPAQAALYTQCVNAAENAASNIQASCQISSNGTNWNAWSTHTKCGL